LTELLIPLEAAATLAGVSVSDTERDTILLPLTVDTAGKHRRKVWTAWARTDGRTGRWGALAAAGCVIRAADLDQLQAYSELRPIEYRQEPEPGAPRGYYRVVAHDRESPDFRPAEAPATGLIPGRMLTR
jgi:hypothetical protein